MLASVFGHKSGIASDKKPPNKNTCSYRERVALTKCLHTLSAEGRLLLNEVQKDASETNSTRSLVVDDREVNKHQHPSYPMVI